MDDGGTIKIEIQGLTQLRDALNNFSSIALPVVQDAIQKAGAILGEHTTRGNVPWNTGYLTQSFRLQVGPLFARWYPTANYANFVYFGTKPHDIFYKGEGRGGLFDKKTGKGFGRHVRHPGTKPNLYLDKIADEATPDIQNLFGQAISKIVAQVAAQTL